MGGAVRSGRGALILAVVCRINNQFIVCVLWDSGSMESLLIGMIASLAYFICRGFLRVAQCCRGRHAIVLKRCKVQVLFLWLFVSSGADSIQGQFALCYPNYELFVIQLLACLGIR